MGGFESVTARKWLVGIGAGTLAAGLLVGTATVPAQANGAGYAFTGTVTQEGTGWPVPFALVAAVDQGGGPYCNTVTQPDGTFTMSNCSFDPNASFRIFVNPPSLANGDDTVDTLGSALIPTDLVSSFTYAGWGDDTSIDLTLTAANLTGTVKKQADDSSVSASELFMSATVLNSDGYMEDTRLPLRTSGSGEFRSTIPISVAPHGVAVTAEPNSHPDPGTFDDTYAAARQQVSVLPGSAHLVLPRINFWGELRDVNGNLVPGDNQSNRGYVSARIGTGDSQTEVLGSKADSAGIVRLYIDRALADSQPVRFQMILDQGQPPNWEYRTYQLADDSGATPADPMVLQPVADNVIVSVFAGDDSDVGAQVYVNPFGGGDSLFDGVTNILGQVSGYVDNPGEQFMVDVEPSNAARAAGFGRFQQNVTPAPLGGGLYELRINLMSENLTINVKTSGNIPVDGAEVFLNTADYQWIGYQQTNGSGQARYGVDPESLEGDFRLEVRPRGSWAAQGLASFNGLVSPDVDNTGNGTVNVTLQQSNVRVYVDDSDGDPLGGADIWITPMNSNAGYSGRTGDTGYAYIYMPPNLLSSFMYINVSAPWDKRNLYSDRVFQERKLSVPVDDGLYTFTATLPDVNSLFRIVKPEAGSPPMAYANLEFREPNDYRTLLWSNANQSGEAGVTLTDGVFDMFVIAPWNSDDDTVYGRTKYRVTVQNETIVSVLDEDSQPAAQDGNRWVVSPQPATYSAVVKNPDGSAVANTWVEILRDVEGWQEYVDGSSTNAYGKFGMNFTTDDTYTVRARPPWGEAGLAPAADCLLVIDGGDVADGSTCGDILILREPNLLLTLVNEAAEPQPNSWACVGRERGWNWACEGASSDGQVALLVDDTVGDDTVGQLVIEANPPWSATDLSPARVIIDDDSFASGATVDETITFASPNVQIQVALDDDTQAARWSWVSIVEIDGASWTWIGGGPANANGVANFSVDDTDGNFCVGVYPPWEERGFYGPKETCNVDLNSGSYGVNLRSANVFTSVIDADGRANSWGWAEIKQGSTSIGGTGLDERGRFVSALEPGTYQVTFYPGWNRVGSPRTVTVVVDGGGNASIPPVVQLGTGNVSGSVKLAGVAYAGVVVIATQGSTVVTAVTDGSGDFTLDLGPGSWDVDTITPDDGVTPTVSFDAGVSWSSPTLVVP